VRRADHSSRGVLQIVMCLSVILKPWLSRLCRAMERKDEIDSLIFIDSLKFGHFGGDFLGFFFKFRRHHCRHSHHKYDDGDHHYHHVAFVMILHFALSLLFVCGLYNG